MIIITLKKIYFRNSLNNLSKRNIFFNIKIIVTILQKFVKNSNYNFEVFKVISASLLEV